MDERLRRLERQRRLGDDDPATVLVARLRSGQLDPFNVQLALHFGLPYGREALAMCNESISVPCASCRSRSPRDESDEERSLSCFKCSGTGAMVLPQDLLPAVKALGEHLSDDLLYRWSSECLEHAAKSAAARPVGRYEHLERAQALARWLADSRSQLDEQWRLSQLQQHARRLRPMCAEMVTACYRLCAHSSEERAWQRQRLAELLVA